MTGMPVAVESQWVCGRIRPAGKLDGSIRMIWPSSSAPWAETLTEHWGEFVTGGAESLVLPGHHDTWLDEHPESIGDLLAESVAAAPSASTHRNDNRKSARALRAGFRDK